jgi:membrane-associated HD superfamily phosphohydrolase
MNVVGADALEASLRTLRSANHRKLRDKVILARLI